MTGADVPQPQVDRLRAEITNRKALVMILAVVACWSGILIMLFGAPRFLEEWFSPWSRYAIGGVPFLSGLISAVAGAPNSRSRRAWFTQVAGTATTLAWFVALGVAYVGLISQTGGLELVGLGEPLDPVMTGRVFAPVICFGLAAVAAVPLTTMLRLGPPSRRG